jgi:tetratricopeptide (TPR) repeat protein
MYFDKPSEAMPKAMDAARHAVSLAPDLTDPHIVIGLVNLLYHWNWDEAKRELMGGDSLRPQVVDTFTCSAHLLETAGHGPEAEREIRQALASDPVSVALKTELGCNSYYQRRYQTAIEEYRRSLELDTGYVIALWGLGRAYAQTKEYDRAIAELKRVEAIHGDAPPMVIGEMGYVYGLAGDRKSAMGVLATLETMSQTIWVDPYLRAIVYLGLGDRTKTLAWLDQAVAVHSPFIPSISSDAKWDAYQSDPTFAALLSRLKLRPAVVAKHSG